MQNLFWSFPHKITFWWIFPLVLNVVVTFVLKLFRSAENLIEWKLIVDRWDVKRKKVVFLELIVWVIAILIESLYSTAAIDTWILSFYICKFKVHSNDSPASYRWTKIWAVLSFIVLKFIYSFLIDKIIQWLKTLKITDWISLIYFHLLPPIANRNTM